MILDKVTSLADLAFKGETNKHYRQLACLTAVSYGWYDVTWKKALEKLNNASLNYDSTSCETVTVDANRCLEEIREDWIEPLEDTKPAEPEEHIIEINTDKINKEIYDGWYGWLGISICSPL